MSKVPGLDIFKRQIITRPLLRAGMDLDSGPHSEMLKNAVSTYVHMDASKRRARMGVLRHVHLFVYFVCFRCALCSATVPVKKERKRDLQLEHLFLCVLQI